MPDACALRAFAAADLPMMADRPAMPHLRNWRGDPAGKLALVTEDLDNPLMDQQIGLHTGCAFACLQSCLCQAWRAPHFSDRPQGSHAVDMCVGPADMLWQGHGATILRLYAGTLLARDATDMKIDPDPDNERVLRCWRRAGLRDVALRPCKDGDPGPGRKSNLIRLLFRKNTLGVRGRQPRRAARKTAT